MLYVLTMLGMQMYCTNMVSLPYSYAIISGSMSTITLVVAVILFSSLVFLMKKHFHHEYKVNIIPMTLYFIIDLAGYSIGIYIYTSERLYKPKAHIPNDEPD